MRILAGKFNIEKYWATDNQSILPTLNDNQMDSIVDNMDEVQCGFVESADDCLITKRKMSNSLVDYFKFLNHKFIDKSGYYENLADGSFQHVKFQIKDSSFSFYGIDHQLYNIAKYYNGSIDLPDPANVKKVNSKKFSQSLIQNLTDYKYSFHIKSAKDLYNKGSQLLLKGDIILKEEFGVSGKGSLLISNIKLLKRICSHLELQEESGSITSLILEEKLEKKIDFSCQIEVAKNGDYKIHSFQEMLNSHFSFGEIRKMSDDLIDFVRNSSYHETIENVVWEIYSNGYYGPLCIDSMILKDKRIIPIIEINARKSFGLLNYKLNSKITNGLLNSSIKQINFFNLDNNDFEWFFDLFQSNDMLYNEKMGKGIIPLASNTVSVNRSESVSNKGRFVLLIIYPNDEKLVEIWTKLIQILSKNIISIF